MAIVIGNKTQSNANPNGTTQTLAHNQNTGSNLMLMVVVTMSNSVNFSGCTYAGSPMTLAHSVLFTSESQRQAVYYHQAPATGSNNIVVSFTGSQFNSTSIVAISFTGADGIDNVASNQSVNTPNPQSLTIITNSIIYASGISSNAQNTGYDIGGSTRTFEFSHNTNIQVRGCLSATGLSAGSQNVTTKADFGNVTNFRVAIKEYVAPNSRRRIIIC